jgi:DNA primase
VVYDKSVNLYQPLPPPRHPDGRVVVVEGTLDAMAIAVAAIQSGVARYFCPVTQSGRELSPRQVATALSMHPGPVLIAMDADSAGRESSIRISSGMSATGRRVLVARLPDGEDPASLLGALGPKGLALFAAGRRPYVNGQRDLAANGPGLGLGLI